MSARAIVAVGPKIVSKHSVVKEFTHLAKMGQFPSSHSVIRALPKLNGDDLATILHTSRRRDELLLVAICESLKSVPNLRLANISRILNAFEKLSFVPSVEVLNVLAKTVQNNLCLYKTRNIDLCFLFRYFSILAANPNLVLKFEAFKHPNLRDTLEAAIEKRIGRFGPAEISIVAKYTERIGLFDLMVNFGRNQNVQPNVLDYFIRKLDEKFGTNAWKQFQHLLPTSNADVTGWNSAAAAYTTPRWEDDDTLRSQGQMRIGRIQLDNEQIENLLNRVPTHKQFFPTVHQSFSPTIHSKELLPPCQQSIGNYIDQHPQRIRRSQETRDALGQKISTNLRNSNRTKSARNRKLFKFTRMYNAQGFRTEHNRHMEAEFVYRDHFGSK